MGDSQVGEGLPVSRLMAAFYRLPATSRCQDQRSFQKCVVSDQLKVRLTNEQLKQFQGFLIKKMQHVTFQDEHINTIFLHHLLS